MDPNDPANNVNSTEPNSEIDPMDPGPEQMSWIQLIKVQK